MLAASDTDVLVSVIVIIIAIVCVILQVLWAIRVMRALESLAQSGAASSSHLDQMRNAIIVVGRHIRGEPDPVAPKPRRAPNL